MRKQRHHPQVSKAWRLGARALRLTARECLLLVAALGVVTVVRLGLWMVPFRTLRKAIAHLPVCLHPTPASSSSLPRSVAWAVKNASRLVPRATCLTQALSTQSILAILGVSAVLRIGVAPGGAKGRLQAHAWLEYGNRVIIGWENHGRFTPFPPIEVVRS